MNKSAQRSADVRKSDLSIPEVHSDDTLTQLSTDQDPLAVEVRQLRRKMMDAIASIMGWYNLTPSASELYAYMFFQSRPVTLEEMKDVMGMSKSNISYAMRSLIHSKMVYKLDYKLDRRELYQADPDFLSSFQKFLTAKLEHEIQVMTDAISNALPRLTEILRESGTEVGVLEEANRDLNKILHAKDYYTWLQKFVVCLKAETL